MPPYIRNIVERGIKHHQSINQSISTIVLIK